METEKNVFFNHILLVIKTHKYMQSFSFVHDKSHRVLINGMFVYDIKCLKFCDLVKYCQLPAVVLILHEKKSAY